MGYAILPKIKIFLHKQNDVFQTMKNNFVEEVCYV